MRIQRVERVGDLNARSDVGCYFQAVALFMRDDQETFAYFSAYSVEIDQITGSAITIILAKQVEIGDAGGVAKIFDDESAERKRFPNLSRLDLPCLWIEDGQGGAAILKIASGREVLKQQIRALADEAPKAASAADLCARVDDAIDVDQGQRNAVVKAFRRAVRMLGLSNERIAMIAGGVFLATMLVIAMFVPNPSPFQYFVFRSVLAISAAAFASVIPGILKITLGNWLVAGGALAVLVLVYMINPAALVIK